MVSESWGIRYSTWSNSVLFLSFWSTTSICIVGHSQTTPLSQRRLSSRWCHSFCPWGSGLEVPDHCTILRTSLPEYLSVFVYLPGPYDKGKYWLKVGETVHDMGGAELQQSPWWRVWDGVASKSWFFFFFKADKVNFQGTVGHLYYNGRNALE